LAFNTKRGCRRGDGCKYRHEKVDAVLSEVQQLLCWEGGGYWKDSDVLTLDQQRTWKAEVLASIEL
jgi:hypothetical protein